ncbi:hypothetical protein EPO33_03450 [Patescibacteria group bacterium]|nr:MAG: hypothetical protein EPO33_03450 [Patescibacteria group bacterium]
MPRLLDPAPPSRPKRLSDGARGLVVALAFALVGAWYVVIGEQARAVRVEMRDLTARLDRFSVRAEAFERDLARP